MSCTKCKIHLRSNRHINLDRNSCNRGTRFSSNWYPHKTVVLVALKLSISCNIWLLFHYICMYVSCFCTYRQMSVETLVEMHFLGEQQTGLFSLVRNSFNVKSCLLYFAEFYYLCICTYCNLYVNIVLFLIWIWPEYPQWKAGDQWA